MPAGWWPGSGPSASGPRRCQAARELIRQRGYNATAFSDVLRESGTSRGSVYFHFPGGKTQLVIEAAEAHVREQIEIIDSAAALAGSVVEFIDLYVTLGRDGMVSSDYARGCGVAPRVTEGAAKESAEVSGTVRGAFSRMTDRLAFHLAAFGVEQQASARGLAEAVLAGVEGAMVTSRALRSPAPYDSLRTVMTIAAEAARFDVAAHPGQSDATSSDAETPADTVPAARPGQEEASSGSTQAGPDG
ncbi:TetR/AcrR family transcriptional regulator [Streptomyces camponoticapitis]|uniref:TetR/AcrR family transcriptional regulator n=1 Tax=Streptomyces camponoticapitis TaxID=1616125 RepID=UPI00166CCE10|nr:TetR/AcrR family transcriptional regulator [Streptomyces camponoticapitis]